MKQLLITPLVILALTSSALHSQIVFQTSGMQTLTFDQVLGDFTPLAVNDVYNPHNSAGGSDETTLSEPGAWWYQASPAGGPGTPFFSTRAWSYSSTAHSWGLIGAGQRTLFGEDGNNNASNSDWAGSGSFKIFQKTMAEINGGSAADNVMLMGDAFAALSLTLRVHNNTGVPISDWSVQMDTFFEKRWNRGSVDLLFSTDNVNFTSFATVATATYVAGSEPDGTYVNGLADFGGSFAASVADGGYLYVQIRQGSASDYHDRFVFDNLEVTAVPEPATLLLLAGMAAVFLGLRHREP